MRIQPGFKYEPGHQTFCHELAIDLSCGRRSSDADMRGSGRKKGVGHCARSSRRHRPDCLAEQISRRQRRLVIDRRTGASR